MIRLAFGVLAALSLVSAAHAEPFVDAATGVTLDAPAPFVVESLGKQGEYDLVLAISSSTGQPGKPEMTTSLCQLQHTVVGTERTQDEINNEERRIAGLTESLAGSFDTQPATTSIHDGHRVIELTGTLKQDPSVTAIFWFIETTKGVTQIFCGGLASEGEAAFEAFRTIEAGLSVP